MFGIFKRKLVTDHFTNLVAEGTEINGSLSFSGVIQIGGVVRGDVISTHEDDKSGNDCVYVIRSGEVFSDLIKASNIVIDGFVSSKAVHATNVLRIGKKARISNAELSYLTLEIEEGAYLHNCRLNNLQEGNQSDRQD